MSTENSAMETAAAAVVCGICHETPKEWMKTRCNHSFCQGCLASWLEKNTSDSACPACHLVLQPNDEFVAFSVAVTQSLYSKFQRALDYKGEVHMVTATVTTREQAAEEDMRACNRMLQKLF